MDRQLVGRCFACVRSALSPVVSCLESVLFQEDGATAPKVFAHFLLDSGRNDQERKIIVLLRSPAHIVEAP